MDLEIKNGNTTIDLCKEKDGTVTIENSYQDTMDLQSVPINLTLEQTEMVIDQLQKYLDKETSSMVLTGWSMSTIKIFLDNANESKASELMYDKEFLGWLLKDLKSERKEMTGIDPGNIEIIKYNIAIDEIRDWIKLV
jgi:hypothetical protein